MGLLTCETCKRILDECEFSLKDIKSARYNRDCKKCFNVKQREYRKNKDGIDGNWLFFGCIHLPFEHPDALDFLERIIKKYKFTKIVMMGDLMDWGGLNRFQKNPNLPSPLEEWSRTIPIRERLYNIIPKAELINGNHDMRPMMRAAEAYLPDIVNIGVDTLMGIPIGWVKNGSRVVLKHRKLGDIVCIHGDKVNKDALTNAKAFGKHVVMADRHTECKTEWVETLLEEKRFGINTGCLIDADREAFAYNRGRMRRPLIAVGAIIDGNPVNLVMHVDQHNRWIDR